MKRFKKYLMAFGAVALMASCYPGGPSYVEDYDITFATKADGADFSDKAANKFFMPNEIFDIGDTNQNVDPVNPIFAAKVLARVEAQMVEYGYTRVADTSMGENYGVAVQRLISDNWVTYYWGGGGYCGWYPYWCGGYYPPTGSTYNYQTGTLYVTMIDLDNSTPTLPFFVWDAGINGLLSSTQSNTEARALNGINKMFELSPYLKKN